jgi:hypothetical protein
MLKMIVAAAQRCQLSATTPDGVARFAFHVRTHNIILAGPFPSRWRAVRDHIHSRGSVDMSSIFLCHSSEDKAFVRSLGKRLRRSGVKVWIDEAELKIGDSLADKLAHGINRCRYLGIVLSPRSVRSSWVKRELSIATALEVSRRKLMVLPILLEECRIPRLLKGKLYADFRNHAQFANNVHNLLRTILPLAARTAPVEQVRRAVRAEFEAYQALPRIKLSDLDRYFTRQGSARQRIVHLLERHRQKKWIITNPGNASSFSILSAELKRLTEHEAEVHTREYWYLKWYDARTLKSTYFLNEEIRPKYYLKKSEDDHWQVDVHAYKTSKCYLGP